MVSEAIEAVKPAQLVERLRRQGFVFSSRTHTLLGRYAPVDARWNYNEDVRHIEYVHHGLHTQAILHGESFMVHLNSQKFLRQWFPVVMLSFEPEADAHSGIATVAGFCLVGDTRWVRVGDDETRVDTTYHVGSGRLLRPLHALVHAALKRNYESLMREDMPMRLRRGELRGWGYSFRHDDARAALRVGENVSIDNVRLPRRGAEAAVEEVRISERLAAPGDRWLVGRSDHLGLQLHRAQSVILAFPRMCLHEGACVDVEQADPNGIRCPWHGRKVGPIARVPLSAEATCVETRWHTIERAGDVLRIIPRDTQPTGKEHHQHLEAVEQ